MIRKKERKKERKKPAKKKKRVKLKETRTRKERMCEWLTEEKNKKQANKEWKRE